MVKRRVTKKTDDAFGGEITDKLTQAAENLWKEIEDSVKTLGPRQQEIYNANRNIFVEINDALCVPFSSPLKETPREFTVALTLSDQLFDEVLRSGKLTASEADKVLVRGIYENAKRTLCEKTVGPEFMARITGQRFH